jgi:hypothetical protein
MFYPIFLLVFWNLWNKKFDNADKDNIILKDVRQK